MQQHLEQENRRALTFLDEDDDKLEYIFKHYKGKDDQTSERTRTVQVVARVHDVQNRPV